MIYLNLKFTVQFVYFSFSDPNVKKACLKMLCESWVQQSEDNLLQVRKNLGFLCLFNLKIKFLLLIYRDTYRYIYKIYPFANSLLSLG